MRKSPGSHFLVLAICSVLGEGCANVEQRVATPPPENDGGLSDVASNPFADLAVRPTPDSIDISDTIRMTCGNGRVDATEGCDDGNTVDGDGCTQLCQVEADWTCPSQGGPCTYTAVCGDGRLAANETCDDGNTVDGDGCSADCKTVEPGWQCRVPGKHCVPLCGDGVVTGPETCDDGNAISGDGCSSTCLREPGAQCPTPGMPCTLAKCGNGVVEAGESCDRGAQLNGLFLGDGTGCSKTCTQEPGCRDGAKTRACDTSCGNGNLETGEQCDDGNQADGDGCSATCKTEAGFTCATQLKADTQPCQSAGATGQCLLLPIVLRDFKSEKEVGGHPDFFYLGSGTGATKRLCVPNSGGPAKQNDSTARCWDLARSGLDATGAPTSDGLDAKGKPIFNDARTNGSLCDCQFTDYSSDTNEGHVPGYSLLNSPLNGYPYIIGPFKHPQFKGTVAMVKDSTSFGQWFVDSTFTGGTHAVTTLELPPLTDAGGTGAAGSQYRFSSNPNSVLGGFFPLDPPGTTPPPGVIRMTASGEPLLCNLWPYWFSSPTFGAMAGCVGDQYLLPPSVATPGWISQMQGFFHDSWFSTEARYLFQFNGGFELQFYGDDDLFMYINGVLVLDLGGIHQRLPGRVQVAADGTASIIEGGALDPVTNAIQPCPAMDPYSNQLANATCPGGTCDCRTRTLDLGLVPGKTYEVAVFHADRHPTESNYQLTLSGFSTNRSVCASQCGDGVITGAEQCDDGANNDDNAYSGCTKSCTFGPFCGDGTVNGPEQCDLGRQNGSPYGTRDGCTTGCTRPHYCGDGIVDALNGEKCDQGEALNGQTGSVCDSLCRIIIP